MFDHKNQRFGMKSFSFPRCRKVSKDMEIQIQVFLAKKKTKIPSEKFI